MVDKRLSDLTVLSDISDDDILYAVTSGLLSRQITASGLLQYTGIVDYIDFNTNFADVEHPEGRLHWDMEDQTLELGMVGGEVKLQIGQELQRSRSAS